MEFQDWMFDKRVLRRNIRKDVITREDYKGYLKALPDTSDNIADEDEEEEQAAELAAAAEQAEAAEQPEVAEQPEGEGEAEGTSESTDG